MDIFYDPLFTLFLGFVAGVLASIIVRKTFCDGCAYVDYWLRMAADASQDEEPTP
jgi:hypothetical protein